MTAKGILTIVTFWDCNQFQIREDSFTIHCCNIIIPIITINFMMAKCETLFFFFFFTLLYKNCQKDRH